MAAARAKLKEQWDQAGGTVLKDVPLRVKIEAYTHHCVHFKRPKSHYKRGELHPKAPLLCAKKPDADNIITMQNLTASSF